VPPITACPSINLFCIHFGTERFWHHKSEKLQSLGKITVVSIGGDKQGATYRVQNFERKHADLVIARTYAPPMVGIAFARCGSTFVQVT